VAPRSRRVVWSVAARTALDEIVDYIARDSREAALQVLTRALETGASLSTLPERRGARAAAGGDRAYPEPTLNARPTGG
jgi:plasmid stabilization system protein ParE